MKRTVNDLEGRELDVAVALALGRVLTTMDCMPPVYYAAPASTDWTVGGPIIESEMIEPFSYVPAEGERFWHANVSGHPPPSGGYRCKSLLTAAMRVLVRHKLGDEIEMPE